MSKGKDGTPPPYRPTARDYQYIAAFHEWVRLPAHAATRKELARLAGMPATKLAGYEAHPRRMAWVREQLAGERRDLQWEHVVERAYQLSMKGDVNAMYFFGKAVGKLLPNNENALTGGSGSGPTQIVMLVPRPEALPEAPKSVGASSTVGPLTDILDLNRR